MASTSHDDTPKKPPAWKQRLERVQAFVVENYLPIAFAVAVTFALAYPVPGRFLVNIVVAGNVHIIQEVNMAIVFLISGVALNTTELRTALRRESWPSVTFGLIMILLVTPALGFAMREIPLTPPAFSVGLTIFCLVPTTLGIGVALVRSCKGNEAIALLLTVVTNMLGVFTMPFYLKLLFLNFETQGLDLNINIPDLLLKLTLTILVPSLIGKALRELFRPVENFAKQYRTALSLFSTTNLACIVWQTLSGARDLLFEQRASMIVSVIVLGVAIHLFYLLINHLMVKFIFHPPLREHVSVVIMASQKSAPVAVTVISYVTSIPAQQGLLAIPSVVGQLSQIFIGAAMAKYIAPKVAKATKAAEAAAKAAAEAKAASATRGDAGADPETGTDREEGEGEGKGDVTVSGGPSKMTSTSCEGDTLEVTGGSGDRDSQLQQQQQQGGAPSSATSSFPCTSEVRVLASASARVGSPPQRTTDAVPVCVGGGVDPWEEAAATGSGSGGGSGGGGGNGTASSAAVGSAASAASRPPSPPSPPSPAALPR